MGNNRVQSPPGVYNIVKSRAGCEFVTHHSKSRSGIREGGGDPDTDQPVRKEIGRGREMGNNRVQCPPFIPPISVSAIGLGSPTTWHGCPDLRLRAGSPGAEFTK